VNYENQDEGAYGVIGRKKGGAVVMSYSPPGERHQKPWLNDRPDSNRDSQRVRMPELTSSRTRPQTAGATRNKVMHQTRTAAIPPSKKYQHVQSRIKDQMDYHKRVHRDMKSQNRAASNGSDGVQTNSKEP
jgi:hypothetical protein